MAKKKSITQNKLIELYMDYVLQHNHAPKSIYSFSKSNGFEEAEFYKLFGNFDALEKSIFGAIAASFTLLFLFPESDLGATIPTIEPLKVFIIELLLSFFLMVVIINVSTGSKEIGPVAGIAVGSVILLEAMFAGPLTKASMNPIRSLAPALASGNMSQLWIYLTAPFIGMLLAVFSCRLVKDENCCDDKC